MLLYSSACSVSMMLVPSLFHDEEVKILQLVIFRGCHWPLASLGRQHFSAFDVERFRGTVFPHGL
jgi:hypothetical protein